MILPEGEYFIGDLSYVMDQEWEEVCDLIAGDQYPEEGQFRLSDGRQFAIFNTAYGDGVFYDQNGRQYLVDSGTIGCIRKQDLTNKEIRVGLGHVVKMPNKFYAYSDSKTIYFDDIVIETGTEENF